MAFGWGSDEKGDLRKILWHKHCWMILIFLISLTFYSKARFQVSWASFSPFYRKARLLSNMLCKSKSGIEYLRLKFRDCICPGVREGDSLNAMNFSWSCTFETSRTFWTLDVLEFWTPVQCPFLACFFSFELPLSFVTKRDNFHGAWEKQKGWRSGSPVFKLGIFLFKFYFHMIV